MDLISRTGSAKTCWVKKHSTRSGQKMSVASKSHGQDLLAFAHGLVLRDLPSDVVDNARTCLLDALGCGIFGSSQVWSRILADEMLAEGASGHSTVIGRQKQLAAPAA